MAHGQQNRGESSILGRCLSLRIFRIPVKQSLKVDLSSLSLLEATHEIAAWNCSRNRPKISTAGCSAAKLQGPLESRLGQIRRMLVTGLARIKASQAALAAWLSR